MYGAILGDIIGSPYEFDFNNYKSKDFPLFCRHSEFTDDTVMTLAVAKALLDTRGQEDAAIKAALVHQMQRLGRAYPGRGYGTRFIGWLHEDDPRPYNSYGNGSAMRVSAAADVLAGLLTDHFTVIFLQLIPDRLNNVILTFMCGKRTGTAHTGLPLDHGMAADDNIIFISTARMTKVHFLIKISLG